MNGPSDMPKRAIVNADDFGFTPGITEGILRAHREGIVTSTTITANMPAAEEALRLLKDAPDLGVGVHLNVAQGVSLSEKGRALAGEDGRMNWKAPRLFLACVVRPWLLAAIEAEFDAQIHWALDHGLTPTHLDTHRHTHAYAPIFARVARVARRYHIPFVRWLREHLPGSGWPAAPARQRRASRIINLLAAGNRFIGRDLRGASGTWGIAHTGEYGSDWLVRVAAAVGPGVTEIMVHPGLPAGLDASLTRLIASRQRELEALCDPAVKEAFKRHGVELTHYGRL